MLRSSLSEVITAVAKVSTHGTNFYRKSIKISYPGIQPLGIRQLSEDKSNMPLTAWKEAKESL